MLVMSLVAPKVTANADSAILTQHAFSYSVGGEFNAVTSQDFTGLYAPTTAFDDGKGLGTGFETFCIESAVDFTPGATYTYTLASVDSQGVNLSEGAAFLYSEFATGILPHYDYADAAIRNQDAGELQAAIWWFQGGQTLAGFPSPTDNTYYTYATNALRLANADSPNDGLYGVDVLQLWNGATPAQNQLVLVPDSASTAMLLGLGLLPLALLRLLPKLAKIT